MTVLPFADGITRWRQIAESLGDEITGAHYPDGRLPTEPDLAARFGVNRHTIRRAVAALAEQGLVRVEHGRGTFIANRHIDYLLGRRTRFSTNLQRQGREPGHRLVATTRGPADAVTAQELALAPGAEIVEITAVGYADGAPVSYGVSRFPAERFAALPAAFAETGSITAALAACGVTDYTRRTTALVARMPTEIEARYLEQPLTRPVLQSDAVNLDAAGVPIQRSVTAFSGDRVQVLVAADEN